MIDQLIHLQDNCRQLKILNSRCVQSIAKRCVWDLFVWRGIVRAALVIGVCLSGGAIIAGLFGVGSLICGCVFGESSLIWGVFSLWLFC